MITFLFPGRRWWGRRRSSRSTCSSPPGKMSPLLGASPLPGFLICISINIIFSFTFIFNLYSVQHPTADGWPTRSKRWSWRTRFARTRSSTTTGSGGPHTLRRVGIPARDRFNILSSKSNILCTFSIYSILNSTIPGRSTSLCRIQRWQWDKVFCLHAILSGPQMFLKFCEYL